MKPYTNKDRWRHIKHFIDSHPYSESNLEYLKNWLTSFTNESMTTENASSENRSHERKTKDEDSRPLSSNPIIADTSHPFGLRIDDSIPRTIIDQTEEITKFLEAGYMDKEKE